MSAVIKAAAVWIVTGEKYVPWALASAATFHAHHREMPLVWLASESAVRKADQLLPEWLRGSLDVRVAAHSGEPDREASRRLKVEARRLIDGDFFQVDADVLLALPLQSADFEKVGVLAAAPNRETFGEFREDPDNRWAHELFNKAGWNWPGSYFNTGFIFWRDNAQAREFSERWERAREEFTSKVGMVVDQPAFNRAADETQWVSRLESRYNAPVNTLPRLARGASCYHYYAQEEVDGAFRNTTLGFLAGRFSLKRADTREAVESFARSPQPFVGWGANSEQYRLAGQWWNYLERKMRVGWDRAKRGKAAKLR